MGQLCLLAKPPHGIVEGCDGSAGSAGQLGCGPGERHEALNWSKSSGAGEEGKDLRNSGEGWEGEAAAPR